MVVAVEKKNRCIKYKLPNGHTVDILPCVNENLSSFRQNSSNTPESCGYILGYKDKFTENITLSDITVPQKNDYRNRVYCILKDLSHKLMLKLQANNKNYYMGVWHTHPQTNPTPSNIDWEDWNRTLVEDKTGCEYAFFIIVGTSKTRIWVGSYSDYSITEIFECESLNGIYLT